ncbi:MAG: PPE domain-containing protein, partial [Sciscionella sp.]
GTGGVPGGSRFGAGALGAGGAEDGAPSGRAGSAGATGRTGPGGMPLGGRGGKGGDDEEHQLASYLVTEDNGSEIVGDVPMTAPPVIGE